MRRRPISPLLAIDTATALTGLALYDDGVVAELVWRSEQNQTVELLPALVWLLKQQGWTVDDLAAVAVSLGPGSFNGLRVGLSTAKGLCFARGIPCLGVETLDAAAFEHVAAERAIRPLYDAGRGEVATALYRGEAGALRRIEEPRLLPLADVVRDIDVPTLVCGELRPEWIELLARRGAQPCAPTEHGDVAPSFGAQPCAPTEHGDVAPSFGARPCAPTEQGDVAPSFGGARPRASAGLDVHATPSITFPPKAGWVRRPAHVAQLGWQRWQSGERDDVVALQPVYLRRPAITPSIKTMPRPG